MSEPTTDAPTAAEKLAAELDVMAQHEHEEAGKWHAAAGEAGGDFDRAVALMHRNLALGGRDAYRYAAEQIRGLGRDTGVSHE